MAGARASFLKKYISNKGLKTTLHAGDLIEFCGTLQTGLGESLPLNTGLTNRDKPKCYSRKCQKKGVKDY